jgi:plasmid stability protein
VAAISVRDLDDSVRERLRVRAAEHGRSMEAEIRAILTDAVAPRAQSRGLAQTLLARFGELGGVELELPSRAELPRGESAAATAWLSLQEAPTISGS